MRISYIVIVLNGMPFIEFSLKAIYDFAYEIIIVEGAVKDHIFSANPDGSSKDGTVEFIKSFPDPEKKIKFIQGKWAEKCEMQNAGAKVATGDYIWLVDSDEVYKKKEIETVFQLLRGDPDIVQINFFWRTFWKSFDYYIHSNVLLNESRSAPRVFKFTSGAQFINHRPIVLSWPRKIAKNPYKVTGKTMLRRGVCFCHYSYVFKSQVEDKVEYRRRRCPQSYQKWLSWYTNCFCPWTIGNMDELNAQQSIYMDDKKSYTTRYMEDHPECIQEYIEQFRSKNIDVMTK